MSVLKIRARSLGLTQSQVAKEMKVSLPTVKRWWAGQGVHLSVLDQLCATMGMSLSQLFMEIEGGSRSYTYSLEQEKLFVQHPKTLALFDLLVSGEDVDSIRRRYSIAASELLKMLLQLDRVGLIELHEGHRFKFKQVGEPQWIAGGPLATKYRRRMIDTFLGDHPKTETTFFIHDYLPEDVVLLKGKIKELENLMLSCNARAARDKKGRKSCGFYLSLKDFEWDLRNLLRAD